MLEKQQAFSLLVARLIMQAVSMGYGVTLGEAWRPQAMCDWYAARGFGIKGSNHEKRLAVDLNLFNAKGQFLTTVADYKPLGEWWEAQGDAKAGIVCCWGGRFAAPDADHFSLEDNGVK